MAEFWQGVFATLGFEMLTVFFIAFIGGKRK
jgi:hypothetical protein